MKDRIKKLRKELDLTQQEFADKLGIKRNTVASYETGKSNLSDGAVSLICREFSVNEEWLRTGKGEMFIEQSQDEQIAAFVGEILKDEDDSFKRRLVSGLAALDDNGWNVLEKFLDSIHKEKD
ncbi:helix-turn-helix transcriptional regulator [Mediterraneibacter glycyrrhizinilyticus]|uniref:helix-turn-helix transcriptional regulator n=1 Tax=Mediterraneibacter glycyrrhizinilyticus TaxID=342942 RepID=UPI00265851D8|nr:helix-turn-helix transcriptional regulator [Mediterraneibacter glycyrrhizinilyticus]MCF2569505.1 helix-turn-helix transcriptional regulator [Mediterraneibacter glycyrrhizinilyticus]